MSALSADLRLDEARRDLHTEGGFFVAQALTETARLGVLHEIEHAAYESLPQQIGEVRTEAELFVLRDPTRFPPGVFTLHQELTERIHAELAGIAGVDRWWPNDVAAQRYKRGSLGISPHLDGKRYVYLIAIFTIAGSAPLTLCADRAGHALQVWETEPGSLVLLRGPGFAGTEDGRPFHAVQGPRSDVRLSLTFRMDSRR